MSNGMDMRQAELAVPWALAVLLLVVEQGAEGTRNAPETYGEKHFCLVRGSNVHEAYEKAVAYARQVEAWYAEFADDSEYVNQIRGELGEFIPPQFLGLEEMAWVGGPIRDGVKLYCKAISRSKAVALVKDQPELYEVQTRSGSDH